MLYGILAEVVVVAHFAFILFAVFGAIVVWFFPRTFWIHLPVVIWAGLVMAAGWICPLTPLEHHLRDLAGQEGYDTGFIEHYLLPLIYPERLTRNLQILLASLVVGWNVLIYGWMLSRRKARRSSS